jgi:hypothetical protein
MTNHNEVTGIAYGLIAANDMDGDVVQELMFGSRANNISEIAARVEEELRQRHEWEDECERKSVLAQEEGTFIEHDDFEPNLDNFESMIDEPTVEGEYEGIKYISSYLGGALHFFVVDSPFITSTARRASPCVPGAGVLHPSRDGDVLCYDVHPSWMFIDPHAQKPSWDAKTAEIPAGWEEF